MLKKREKFIWNDRCQSAFQELKAKLTSAPVLSAPDFEKPFKVAVDASDVAAGVLLIQDGIDGLEHPVSYFSKKFNIHQKKYSTVEKEMLALLLALQHFEVYVNSGLFPVVVYSGHNPLKFLDKFKNKD